MKSSRDKSENITTEIRFCFLNFSFIVNHHMHQVLHSNKIQYKPPHDKTNKMACGLSKDSDQPGRMTRLTRVFAGRTVILLVLS